NGAQVAEVHTAFDADSLKLGYALRIARPATKLNGPGKLRPQQPLARIGCALLRIRYNQSIIYVRKPLSWKPPQHSPSSLDELSWVPGGGQDHSMTNRWHINAFIKTSNRYQKPTIEFKFPQGRVAIGVHR